LPKQRASRLAVRPTARGWQAMAIGLAVLAVARLIGTTQLHQLAYALLALIVAAFVLGLLGSRGLRFSRALPSGIRLTAGVPSRVDLVISNDSRLSTSRLDVVDRLPEPRRFRLPSLGRRERAVVEAPVTFARRGIYELGPAEARAVDPFGMLRFVRRFDERAQVVVYPEVHELLAFPLSGDDAEAGTRGTLGRQGDEFAGLREYRRGDDRRHIHWKSLARTGELFVKEFSFHAPRRYTVALDLRRQGIRAPQSEIEDAVSAAASVLTHLAREHLPCRLICTDRAGSSTEFGSDEASYWRAMRLLATARADGDRALGDSVFDEREGLGEGIVLISRTPDEDLPEHVRRLKGAGLTVVVVALAAHTYRGHAGAEDGRREATFLREVGRLEAAGAAVRVLRHPSGVAGLFRPRERGAV
jgi:uncharacterized protein (DUF58 family)